MDPDTALANAREALRNLDPDEPATEANAAIWQLAEAFEALDSWLSRGGFLPSDWQR